MTIRDIAKESGYSVSTVSRVLNHRRDVSPKAKERIEEIVARHHFTPNNNAKHLKQTSSKTIAVLVKGTSNMLFASIVEEIQKTVEHTRYTVTVSYMEEEEDEVEQAVTACREQKPMGILFLGGNPDSFRKSFAQITVPCVLVTNQAKELGLEGLSSVSTDDMAAAECAVDFLIEKGHQKIGILGGNPNTSYTSRQRLEGCRNSFRKHDILWEEAQYYEKARFSFESAYRGALRLLEKAEGMTAVFAMSDVMAIGAIRSLIDQGLMVPEDISVMGFDGTALAEYYHPKLATIKQQHHTLAARSVEILLDYIDRDQTFVHEIVPFRLTPGESVKEIKK